MKADFILVEKAEHLIHLLPIKSVFLKQSRFQRIEFGENPKYGRCLILDGAIQLAEFDEFIYHEFLVQPAMHIKKGESVLILGGGDGCAVREVLKHRNVKRIVLVDIDGEVVNACRNYLERINEDALKNARVHIIIGDAKKYVDEADEKFDIVISDITDPDVVGEYFYSKVFVNKCRRLLNKNGVFVTQAGPLSYGEPTAKKVYENIEMVFGNTVVYGTPHIGSFNSTWGFVIGSDALDVSRIRGESECRCRMFSPRLYAAMVEVGKSMRGAESRIVEFDYHERKIDEINGL